VDDDYDFDSLDISLPPDDGIGGTVLACSLGGTSIALFAAALILAAGCFVLGLPFLATCILFFVALIIWYVGFWLVTLLNAAGTLAGLAAVATGCRRPEALAAALPGLILNALALAGEIYVVYALR
jgi:hypothetical protein